MVKYWTVFFLVFVLWVCQKATAKDNRTSFGRIRNIFSPTKTFKKVCYDKLGCFWSGPPFHHPVWRPISVPPMRPEVQGTKFYLYTRRNRGIPVAFTPLKLDVALTSHFNARRWTRILVHGVFDGVDLSSWMRAAKDSYLSIDDDNVILVDYGSKVPPLFLTAANARVIGAQIWLLIKYLNENFGAIPENVHIIGHGLGAHIAGYAGERLHKLGRITGLDPSGPYFRNVPNVVKLDPTDAVFVDVIHSNPGRNILEGVGTIEDVGHVNFRPAGGKPGGCALSPLRALTKGELLSEFLQNVFFCRHFRATDFFRFSFNQNGCLFVGTECSSWEEFYVGRCNCGRDGEKCRIMGQFSTPAPYEKRYYLQVGKERPYCLHQYQLIIYLEIPKHHMTYGSLHIAIDLAVSGDRSIRESLRFSVSLMENRQFKTFLLTFNHPVGKVRNAVAVLLFPLQIKNTTVNLEAVEINYLFPLRRLFGCVTSQEDYWDRYEEYWENRYYHTQLLEYVNECLRTGAKFNINWMPPTRYKRRVH